MAWVVRTEVQTMGVDDAKIVQSAPAPKLYESLKWKMGTERTKTRVAATCGKGVNYCGGL